MSNTNASVVIEQLPQIERLRIISLVEASRLSGLSIDGLERHHADKIITLSPRRRGMRLHHALMLGEAKLSV